MDLIREIIGVVDEFVWGPVMLVLLVGTGVFLTIRTRGLAWINLPYAIKSTLSKEARKKSEHAGDISPFSALTTALAATIGTGNIVGVATAMVSGGPGALVWMWISAFFGITTKFSECMLSIKYREVNEKGEMSGGPMYTIKKTFKNKHIGSLLGWLFALFAVLASFGIGNFTQGNSISTALNTTFNIPLWVTGIVITIVALFIIVGGIESISKVSQVVVPGMAIFYIVAALIVIIGNITHLPAGLALIFKMAFSFKSVTGGVLGTIVASMTNGMRYGVARGCFSNEAGLGSAAITAAAATTDNPVKQGYINMTGTFWDTIVVCTITGLCIASSGVLGMRDCNVGTYSQNASVVTIQMENSNKIAEYSKKTDDDNVILTKGEDEIVLTPYAEKGMTKGNVEELTGSFKDDDGNVYTFEEDGTYKNEKMIIGAALTIEAFKTVLGKPGAWFVTIGIVLFAFSTILGWEYHGEKAFEYIFKSSKYNILYRIVFSLLIFVGATTALDIVWDFSDIANALMAIPNLICLLALSGEIAKDMKAFQKELNK